MRRIASAGLGIALIATACSSSTDPSPVVATTLPPPPTTGTAAPVTSTTQIPESTAASSLPPGTTVPPTTTLPPVDIDDLDLELVEVASGFEQPVFLTAPPTDPRLFVVEQPGIIWVIDGEQPEMFIDLSDLVSAGGERGLLGMAFHPDFASNGLLYLDYTGNGGETVVAELQVGDDPNRAEFVREVMSIPQPAGNHNGGMIAFGPDGFLWIAMGDGGGGGDVYGNGQDRDTPLGGLLRIDVGAGDPYGIPADNPFRDGAAPELWAYGLRNPWRFSFDGDLIYIADVGQGDVEEIDVSPADVPGLNYGWPIFEGTECFAGPCDTPDLVAPVTEYRHDEGRSIIGGYVYRGEVIPGLQGAYFYTDLTGGWLRSIRLADGDIDHEREWLPPGTIPTPSSFGVDGVGELYVTTLGGTVFRLVER